MTTTTKPSVSIRSNNGARVEAIADVSNDRYNKNYRVNVNGSYVCTVSQRGRGRYAFPAMAGSSYRGLLADAVSSCASAATEYHLDDCPASYEHQVAHNAPINWDLKCSCGTLPAAVEAAKTAQDPRAIAKREAAREAKIQAVKDARKALYPQVVEALAKFLGEDEDPTYDADDDDAKALPYFYRPGLMLNPYSAVENNKVEISLTTLAAILGLVERDLDNE